MAAKITPDYYKVESKFGDEPYFVCYAEQRDIPLKALNTLAFTKYSITPFPPRKGGEHGI